MNDDFESIKVESQNRDLDCLIKIYLNLWINLKSLTETEETEILEKLLFKMQLNFFSLSVLLKGTKYHDIDNVYDIPSIFTLTRTLIENYVTFEYLFVIKNKSLKNTSREDRIRSYKFAGYKNLKQIEKINHNITKIKDIEVLLDKLKIDMLKSIDQLDTINPKKFEKPRMEYCWADLITKSKLQTTFFLSNWKLFSNYSHSEHISINGLNNYISNHNAFLDRRRCYRSALIIISLLISTIVDLFPNLLKNTFDKIESEKQDLIFTYSTIINEI